jgi:hypothetical protein
MQGDLKIREVLMSLSYSWSRSPNNNKNTFSTLDNFHEERVYTYQMQKNNQKDN